MSYEQFLRRFLGTPAGAILASNALDGETLALHGVGIARDLLVDAYRAGGEVSDQPDAEFFRLIEDVILRRGERSAADRNGTHDYLERLRPGCQGLPPRDTVTVVWPFGALSGLPSARDQQRFSRLTGLMHAPGVNWMRELSALPPEERYFRPARRAYFGQAFVWITSTGAMRPHIDGSVEGFTPADVCRDVLGLIHRQPETPSMVLVALHFPFALIDRLRSARPSFAEAGSHARFSARVRDLPETSAGPLGQTIHLGRLAEGEGLCSGAPERIVLAFKSSDFRRDEVVRFDVLGPVTVPRGHRRSDNTSTFASALRERRTTQSFLKALI